MYISKHRKNSDGAVLEVNDLKIVFHSLDKEIFAVNGVSFALNAGELLGVVGESGSGKSVTMLSLVKLLPAPPAQIASGQVIMEGQNVLEMDAGSLRKLRGEKVGFIFQDPMTSLNPVLTVGYQLAEPLRVHLGLNRSQARSRAIELMEMVGIPSAETRLDDYPHRFSGGMRQRVMIAMAISCNPKVLIADEPTTALDVTIQAQIVDLIRKLRRELGTAIIWVTHDLGVLAGIADRVLVMYGGFIVECAPAGELYSNPRHPYTQALINTLPNLTGPRPTNLESIGGQPPLITKFPTSCPFAPRCARVHDRCLEENPPLVTQAAQHEVACWLASEGMH